MVLCDLGQEQGDTCMSYLFSYAWGKRIDAGLPDALKAQSAGAWSGLSHIVKRGLKTLVGVKWIKET